jgi:hypothetical protein
MQKGCSFLVVYECNIDRGLDEKFAKRGVRQNIVEAQNLKREMMSAEPARSPMIPMTR